MNQHDFVDEYLKFRISKCVNEVLEGNTVVFVSETSLRLNRSYLKYIYSNWKDEKNCILHFSLGFYILDVMQISLKIDFITKMITLFYNTSIIENKEEDKAVDSFLKDLKEVFKHFETKIIPNIIYEDDEETWSI